MLDSESSLDPADGLCLAFVVAARIALSPDWDSSLLESDSSLDAAVDADLKTTVPTRIEPVLEFDSSLLDSERLLTMDFESESHEAASSSLESESSDDSVLELEESLLESFMLSEHFDSLSPGVSDSLSLSFEVSSPESASWLEFESLSLTDDPSSASEWSSCDSSSSEVGSSLLSDLLPASDFEVCSLSNSMILRLRKYEV